ncbi:MAG: glycosyltransferase, partial [Pseudomonadota bacterium]
FSRSGRMAEIPALGTAMVAPRTSAHQALYQEGIEALFYETVEDCAACCLGLLSDAEAREKLARAGHARVALNGMYNEPLLSGILDAALAQSNHRRTHVAS